MKRRKKKKNRLKSSFVRVTKNFIYIYIFFFYSSNYLNVYLHSNFNGEILCTSCNVMKIIKIQCKPRRVSNYANVQECAYSETKHASSYNALLFGIYDGAHENDGKGWSRIPLHLLSYRDL